MDIAANKKRPDREVLSKTDRSVGTIKVAAAFTPVKRIFCAATRAVTPVLAAVCMVR